MFFKKGDLIIYILISSIFLLLITSIKDIKNTKAERIEIYVNNKLKYTYKLQKQEKNFYIPTDIGGVGVQVMDNRVRVTSSHSPRKLCVKQGWIENSGETIIGVPDKLLIKISGNSNDIDILLH